jgi:hypothetical protein
MLIDTGVLLELLLKVVDDLHVLNPTTNSLIATIMASRVILVQLRSPLCIDTDEYSFDSIWPHECLLGIHLADVCQPAREHIDRDGVSILVLVVKGFLPQFLHYCFTV